MSFIQGRSGRVIFLWTVVLLFPFFSSALAIDGQSGVRLEIETPGPIDTEPNRVITVAFRLTSLSQNIHIFRSATQLPEGWRHMTEDSPVSLIPGQTTVRLVSFHVPQNALAQQYQLGYSVMAAEDSSLCSSLSVDINVLLKANLEARVLQAPQVVIAGEEFHSQIQVSNLSNRSFSIGLKVESTEGYPCDLDRDELRLNAGESEILTVKVRTDSKIRNRINHNFQLKANVLKFNKEVVEAAVNVRTEIIPLKSGEEDYKHKYPAGIKWIGFIGENTGSVLQLELSGSGAIPNMGIKEIDFLLRGPGKTELLNFGLYREEYRLSIETGKIGINLGDRVFSLTKLSEYGMYGRGAEGRVSLGRFYLRTYYQESLFSIPAKNQKALQLNYRATENLEFTLSYLNKKEKSIPENNILSIKGHFVSDPFNLSLEYARGENGINENGRSDYAYWVETFGNIDDIFSYRLNRIQAGPMYPGSYSGLLFNSARLSLFLYKKLRLRASYSNFNRNTQDNSIHSTNEERYTLFGLHYRWNKRIDLGIDYKEQARTAVLQNPSFDYIDRAVRFSISPHLGFVNLQGLVDIGKTLNRLTGETRSLVDLNASGTVTFFKRFAFSGYFQLRDQEEDFTGDYERNANVNISLKFNLGKTDVYAFYRKSMYYEFFDRILFDQSLVEELLYNHLDIFEIVLKQHLFKSHSISFRLRHASNAIHDLAPEKEIIGLVEYTIPVGLPVGRNQEVGELSGRVYDAQNGRAGIAGVIVKIGQRMTVSNKDGLFVFHGLKAGTSFLSVEQRTLGPHRVTLQPTPISIDIPGGRKTECQVGVMESGMISGQIILYGFVDDEAKVQFRSPKSIDEIKYVEKYGLANTLVELRGEQNVYRQISDENGVFRFDELRPGKWELRIIDEAPDDHHWEKSSFDFDIDPGERDKVLIRGIPRVRQIKLLGEGVVSVKQTENKESVKSVSEESQLSGIPSKTDSDSAFSVQVASFLFEKNATAVKERLMKKFKDVYLTVFKKNDERYHVVRIKAEDLTTASKLYRELCKEGFSPLILRHGKITDFRKNGIEDGKKSPYSVQVASYSQEKSALELKTKLQKNFDQVHVVQYKNGNETYYRVRIKASNKDSARALSQEIEKLGFAPLVFKNGNTSN